MTRLDETQLNQSYDALAQWAELLPQNFDSTGQLVYKGSRNELRRYHIADKQVIAKRFCVPNVVNRVVYATLRPPKARRSYLNAMEILRRGINTPEPVWYGIEHTPLVGISFYVCADLGPNYTTIYHLSHMPAEESRRYYEALGLMVARLHKAEVWHRDLSPGNVMMREHPDGTLDFSLVDINRVTFGKMSLKRRFQNFARLWGTRQQFEIMSRAYAEAMGLDSELCTREILHYASRFWRRYSHRHPIEFPLDF